jgi:hypothetical protein
MYKYAHLPSEHIRLAELFPGQFNDKIVVSLHPKRFNSEEFLQYEALSYVWASGPNIVYAVGGQGLGELQVTDNLTVALRHLRFGDRSRFLWVDALCINQSDNAEKGSQVAMMGEIYRLAARVIVWLGPEENESSHVLTMLEDMGSNIDLDQDSFSISPSKDAHDPRLADLLVDLPYAEDDLTSIYKLLCRPWFERLWVRQEILLASDAAIVVSGFCVVHWQPFQRGLACIYLKGHKKFRYDNELTDRLDVLRSLLFGQKRMTLSTVRRDFGMLRCSDPRDRVYSILAILRRHYRDLKILPDYNQSVTRVYENFTTRYISRYADLSILTACQLSESWGAPSWVPDWSKRVSSRVETRIWSASLMFASGHFATPVCSPINGKLQIMGMQLGTIQRLQTFDSEKLARSNMVDIIREILSEQPLLSGYFNGISLLEAYVRTMCLDAFAESFRPSLEHLPRLEPSIEIVREILGTNANTSDLQQHDDVSSIFLSKAQISLGGRSLYRLDNGYIGLAPVQTKLGDVVCVILGSNLPMILRWVEDSRYLLVGTCYTCGVSQGEAFLGRLPDYIQMIPTLVGQGPNQQWQRTFVNKESGVSSLEDPRLSTWPIDDREYSKQLDEHANNFLKVDLDLFRTRSIRTYSFTLV